MKIVLENLTKIFPSRNKKSGEEVVAVNNFNFEIPDGKLIGLLGPSGCGKSTTLYMISGLQKPTSGKIFFGEDDVTELSTEKRGIGLVFQNYALYPHMTVLQNILFPLQNLTGADKLPKEKMLDRAREAARLVQIEELLDRKPSELSGGQQQRVAIARALAKEPQLLLLDEPLSNLDAKLRVEMREEILRIQRASKVTTVFVTHDQEEASSIADEVILLKLGVLQQQDSARRLYDEPVNFFTADFLGAPPINKLRGTVENGVFRFENADATLELPLRRPVEDGTKAILAVRAESIVVPAEEKTLRARVIERYSINKDELSVLEIEGQQCRGFIAGDIPLALGQDIDLSLKRRGVFLFDAETGERLS